MPIDSKLPICEQCLAMDLNPRLHQPHLAGKPGTSQSVERWILRRIVLVCPPRLSANLSGQFGTGQAIEANALFCGHKNQLAV